MPVPRFSFSGSGSLACSRTLAASARDASGNPPHPKTWRMAFGGGTEFWRRPSPSFGLSLVPFGFAAPPVAFQRGKPGANAFPRRLFDPQAQHLFSGIRLVRYAAELAEPRGCGSKPVLPVAERGGGA